MTTQKLDVLPAGSQWAIIVDIDGTLANNDHRRRFVDKEYGCKGTRDFKSFNAAMMGDTVCQPVVTIMNCLRARDFAVLLVTGRGEEYRVRTEAWLKAHAVWSVTRLYMRPAGDNRPDVEIKLEILEQIKADGYAPHFAIDDRNRCVKMWRDAGLICFQIQEGDF